MNAETNRIASQIKSLRSDFGKGQKELAQVLGITQQQYSLYERGVRPLSNIQIIKICQYYKVSADYIFGLPDDYARTRQELADRKNEEH